VPQLIDFPRTGTCCPPFILEVRSSLARIRGLEYYLIRDNMRNNCFPDRNYGSNSCQRTDGQLSSIFDYHNYFKVSSHR
jgi:hypothetical protein